MLSLTFQGFESSLDVLIVQRTLVCGTFGFIMPPHDVALDVLLKAGPAVRYGSAAVDGIPAARLTAVRLRGSDAR